MITAKAKSAFNQLLLHAINGHLIASPEHVRTITALPDLSQVKHPRVVVLTIASYLFRAALFIHFTPNPATREYIAACGNTSAVDIAEQVFIDALCERGNMFCGALSRELGAVFPHLGMSTPNILDRACAAYLAALGCGHVHQVRVEINTEVQFVVGLCVSEYADLDFSVDLRAPEESAGGELEMF